MGGGFGARGGLHVFEGLGDVALEGGRGCAAGGAGVDRGFCVCRLSDGLLCGETLRQGESYAALWPLQSCSSCLCDSVCYPFSYFRIYESLKVIVMLLSACWEFSFEDLCLFRSFYFP